MARARDPTGGRRVLLETQQQQQQQAVEEQEASKQQDVELRQSNALGWEHQHTGESLVERTQHKKQEGEEEQQQQVQEDAAAVHAGTAPPVVPDSRCSNGTLQPHVSRGGSVLHYENCDSNKKNHPSSNCDSNNSNSNSNNSSSNSSNNSSKNSSKNSNSSNSSTSSNSNSSNSNNSKSNSTNSNSSNSTNSNSSNSNSSNNSSKGSSSNSNSSNSNSSSGRSNSTKTHGSNREKNSRSRSNSSDGRNNSKVNNSRSDFIHTMQDKSSSPPGNNSSAHRRGMNINYQRSSPQSKTKDVCGSQGEKKSDKIDLKIACTSSSSSTIMTTSSSSNLLDTTASGGSASSRPYIAVANGSRSSAHSVARESSSSSSLCTVKDSGTSDINAKDCSSTLSPANERDASRAPLEAERFVRGATIAGRRMRSTAVRPRADGSATVTEEAAAVPSMTLPPQPRDGWAARMPILRLRVDPTTGDVLLADEVPSGQQQRDLQQQMSQQQQVLTPQGQSLQPAHCMSPSPCASGLLKSGETSPSPVSTTDLSTEPPASPEAAEVRSVVSSPSASMHMEFPSRSDQAASGSQRVLSSSSGRLGSSSSSVRDRERRRREEHERSAATLRYRLGSELAAAGAAAADLHAATAGSEAYAAASRRAERRQRDTTATLATGPSALSPRQVLTLGGGSSRARVIEHETYTETQHGSERPEGSAADGREERQGFTWGEKVARDGSWRERWMQQLILEEATESAESQPHQDSTQQQQRKGKQHAGEPETQEEQASTEMTGGRGGAAHAEMRDRPTTRRRLFGQAQGINETRRERWTSRWEETEGQQRVVEKAVQELNEEGEVLQEWVEIIREDFVTGERSVSKQGEDYRGGSEDASARRWIHNTKRGKRRRQKRDVEEIDAAVVEGGDSVETRVDGAVSALVAPPLSASAAVETEDKDEGASLKKETAAGADTPQSAAVQTAASEEEEESEEEEMMEETKGGVTRGQRRRRGLISGREEHSVWYVEEGATEATGTDMTAAPENSEQWQESWIEDPRQGTKRGKKSGVNRRGERWEEKWKEDQEGIREVRRWFTAADGCRQWGETVRSATSTEATDTTEEAHERWEVRHSEGAYVSFTDRWWVQPQQQNSWGEKKKVSYSTPAASASCGETKGSDNTEGVSHEEVEEVNETWYDNGKEKAVDEWTTKLHVVKTEGERGSASSVRNEETDTTPSRRVIKEVKSGRKHTERYEDGMRWGETWHETREPETSSSSSTSSSEETAVLPESSLQSSLSPQRQILVQQRRDAGETLRYAARPAVAAVPSLQLTSSSRDLWWREAHGNSWGEKTYTDQQRGIEQREKWYDNGFERQVDRWHVESDGSSHGEKCGSKLDGTEWHERWGKGGAAEGDGLVSEGDRETFCWFDKSWKERRQGGGEDGSCCEGWWEWGETAGNEGQKRWQQHWWKNAYSDGGGKDFVAKWEDDGKGNSRTVKTGSSWREGSEGQRAVTCWFEDSYGEVQDAQEKWAYKRGYNEEGDSWMEKWNDKPSEKTAEKQGSNSRGDNWREKWRETFDDKGEKTETWAEKAGSNAQGDSWYETWQERGCWWKTALKEGNCGRTGEHWVEKWGEELQQNGAGEKWCQKYSCNSNTGDRHGRSWGDRWGPEGRGGHAWGEEWGDGQVHKWWHDTPGRPEGC